jgi:predicted Zn-dependent protease
MTQAIAGSDKPQPSWSQILMASYFEMDQPKEAARIAEQLLAQNPDDKGMLMNLSSIYLQADMYDKAVEVLDGARARGMLTTDRDYQQLYRVYLNMDGKEREAIAVMKEGLDKGILQPSHDVYSLMGQAYYFSDQIPQAIEAYREASKHATSGDTALNLARILYNEEKYAEGKVAANEALQKGLKRPGDAYVILGNIEYYGFNNKSAGVAAFEQAAKYPETKEQAEKWLAQARR